MTRAEVVLDLCQRFGCLPSALYEEPVELLQLLRIEKLGRPEEGGVDYGQ